MCIKANYGKNPKCGEIWMCQITIKSSSVQTGYRPVFILSNDKNNTYAPTLNVIPLTTKMNKRNLPIHVELWDYGQYGLRQPSTLLIEQITTIPIESLEKCVGVIENEELLNAIWEAMLIQFPILQRVRAEICG